MAVYQKNKIQEDVRIALDQNANSDTLKIIGDVDTPLHLTISLHRKLWKR